MVYPHRRLTSTRCSLPALVRPVARSRTSRRRSPQRHPCVAVAPTSMPRQPGDPVKTVKRDARKLAGPFLVVATATSALRQARRHRGCELPPLRTGQRRVERFQKQIRQGLVCFVLFQPLRLPWLDRDQRGAVGTAGARSERVRFRGVVLAVAGLCASSRPRIQVAARGHAGGC